MYSLCHHRRGHDHDSVGFMLDSKVSSKALKCPAMSGECTEVDKSTKTLQNTVNDIGEG